MQEKERLEKLQERASERLVNVPDGSLRLSKSQGSVQYYHCKKGGPHNGKYIHKENFNLAQELAQKAYDEKVLNYTEKAITKIDRLLNIYGDERIAEIYASEHR